MRVCSYIFVLYLIAQVGTSKIPLEDSDENAKRRKLHPLMVSAEHHDDVDPYMLREIKNLLTGFKTDDDLAKAIALRIETEKRTIHRLTLQIGDLTHKIEMLTGELSIYKSRGAIEAFEDKHCNLRPEELKEQYLTLLRPFLKEDVVVTERKLMLDMTKKLQGAVPQISNIKAFEYAEQIFVRKLRFLYIFQNLSMAYEVKLVREAILKKGLAIDIFSEDMGIAYHFLSAQIHNSFFSKLPVPLITAHLTNVGRVNEAVETFLSVFDFEKPSYPAGKRV